MRAPKVIFSIQENCWKTNDKNSSDYISANLSRLYLKVPLHMHFDMVYTTYVSNHLYIVKELERICFFQLDLSSNRAEKWTDFVTSVLRIGNSPKCPLRCPSGYLSFLTMSSTLNSSDQDVLLKWSSTIISSEIMSPSYKCPFN